MAAGKVVPKEDKHERQEERSQRKNGPKTTPDWNLFDLFISSSLIILHFILQWCDIIQTKYLY